MELVNNLSPHLGLLVRQVDELLLVVLLRLLALSDQRREVLLAQVPLDLAELVAPALRRLAGSADGSLVGGREPAHLRGYVPEVALLHLGVGVGVAQVAADGRERTLRRAGEADGGVLSPESPDAGSFHRPLDRVFLCRVQRRSSL